MSAVSLCMADFKRVKEGRSLESIEKEKREKNMC